MKKPEKIVKWFHIEQEKEGIFVDHNGKPACKYFVRLPYWLCRAYSVQYVKIEIRDDTPSYNGRRAEENNDEYQRYFEQNWRRKMDKMRKLNHGYILISNQGRSQSSFSSLEDYNNYHRELRQLNKKYGV